MLTVPPVFVATTLVISERVAAEYPDRTLAKSSAAGRKLRIRKKSGKVGAEWAESVREKKVNATGRKYSYVLLLELY